MQLQLQLGKKEQNLDENVKYNQKSAFKAIPASKEPALASNEPASASEEPTPASEEPAPASEEPAPAPEEPEPAQKLAQAPAPTTEVVIFYIYIESLKYWTLESSKEKREEDSREDDTMEESSRK